MGVGKMEDRLLILLDLDWMLGRNLLLNVQKISTQVSGVEAVL